jgi:hypothetical protein
VATAWGVLSGSAGERRALRAPFTFLFRVLTVR